MNPMQEAVRKFHLALGSPAPDKLTFDQIRRELRAKLIFEEAVETVAALGFDVVVTNREGLVGFIGADTLTALRPINADPNWPEVVDGLCDLLVVTIGTAVELGLDLQPFFDEVMRANMDKQGGALREDGKHLKPEGWKPPRIAQMLEAVQIEEKIDAARPLKKGEGRAAMRRAEELLGAGRSAEDDWNDVLLWIETTAQGKTPGLTLMGVEGCLMRLKARLVDIGGYTVGDATTTPLPHEFDLDGDGVTRENLDATMIDTWTPAQVVDFLLRLRAVLMYRDPTQQQTKASMHYGRAMCELELATLSLELSASLAESGK